MTGKRPRALTRTASVSHLGSGSLSQEFSPLPENPTEKLRPSPPPAAASPRVVIGFDPKPAESPKSAPCSPCFNDKASSPRSVLNSLFSRQRCVKPSDGVGLGIALHDTKPATPPDGAHHIAVPASPRASPAAHSRRHSHPIPTPGISACHFSHQTHDKPAHPQPQPAARPALGWLDHDALKVDRRDTFLLGASPSRSLPPTTTTSSSSHFLDECSFCKRHLPEDKDIFMYRGDKAFCSVECRSQQMLMDERSKNCSSSALKKGQGAASPSQRTRVAAASSVAAA